MGGTRSKKKQNYKPDYVKGAFTAVEDDLLLSRTFRKLKPGAVIVLLHMLRVDKTLNYKGGGSYSGVFALTYTELERLGVSRPTMSAGIKQLEETRFIKVVSRGGKKSDRKTASYYRILEGWRTWGGVQTLKELKILKEAGKTIDFKEEHGNMANI